MTAMQKIFSPRTWLCCLTLGVLLICAPWAACASAAENDRIALPPPDKKGGKPLMQCLNMRKSARSFSNDPLPPQELSNLLWATWGVNREDGRRTAPTARNEQEVLVLAVMENGVWRYDGESHSLIRELRADARARFGGAPLTLLYAAAEGPFAGMHVGSLYQNAGLYCASAGLANVVKATGVSALEGELRLPKRYAVLIIQSVGFPAQAR